MMVEKTTIEKYCTELGMRAHATSYMTVKVTGLNGKHIEEWFTDSCDAMYKKVGKKW
jgi:hypothetical protein